MSTSPQTIAKNMSCLRPLDGEGLKNLGEKGKANPDAVVTLKAKTVCEGQFRMQTYVRDLAPMLIDEPPHLLGENNAPVLDAIVWAAFEPDRREFYLGFRLARALDCAEWLEP